jgi:arginyl-tRNA synthetase
MDAMTSFEGDTGPYLQYAHARLNSILRKAQIDQSETLTADLSLLTETKATHLIRIIARYPDTVIDTVRSLEPCTILVYLFRMTHALSSSYEQLQVIGAKTPELARARLALYLAARAVLANGMRLLGLSPVERM